MIILEDITISIANFKNSDDESTDDESSNNDSIHKE